MKKIVVALGGNAILKPGDSGTFQEQYESVKSASNFLAQMVKSGYELVISHGNGPQIGDLLMQNEIASKSVPEFPLYALIAETQGSLGYILEENLTNTFIREKIDKNIATLLTRVEVSLDDPAFKDPTKPIGRFYNQAEYEEILKEKKFPIKEDANRGYRRVVYSPRPIKILNDTLVKQLLNEGNLVIATGGGGIPVAMEDGAYKGVDAVIDKDLTSAKLAESIDADILMILTDVEYVYINFGKANQTRLETVTVDQMETYIKEGQFSAGSMLPKVRAAVEFAKLGKTSYIGYLDKANETLEGKSGTKIIL